MPVEHVHTYLVHPRTPDGEGGRMGGATVPLAGKLFELLNEVYAKSDLECDIDISFNPTPAGAQENECRSLITAYLAEPSLARGREIAVRLEGVTTNRSGLGLLFLISGTEGEDRKIVVSRFPADSAILAEENQEELSVAFLERVFMKSAHSYKAAAYRGRSMAAGFWQGRAIDKQIANPIVRVSEYWIKGFLDSDFRTTPAAGTRRLAVALRDAGRTAGDLAIKGEIAAAATLALGLDGTSISIATFQERFGLSELAKQEIAKHVRGDVAANEQFLFNSEEFSKQIAFRSVELDNGAILTAQTSDFDRVFTEELVDAETDTYRFSTTGVVTNSRLRKVA